MRISTSLMYQRGVNAIESQQVKLSATEEQLATGERLKSPADDPFASTRIIALDEEDKLLAQYARNSDAAKSRLQLEETAITSAINSLQRLRELSIQTANGIYAPEDRRALAEEAYQIMDGIIQVANTVDSEGEYIFSGDRTTAVPFEHDGSGNFTYNGDQGERFMQIGKSRQVQTGDSGFEVFENVTTAAGTASVMKIAYDYYAALETTGTHNPDSISDIDAALQQLIVKRSQIGGRINSIESEYSANEAYSQTIKENRSKLADLDYADAISRFQQELAGLQAAQQSFIKIQGLSLFNYI
jgi:flagellar hook-associated protein 3 FlgL